MARPHSVATPGLAFQAARPELCLDYANTCCWRGTDSPQESLQAPEDVLGWAKTSGGVPPGLVAALSEMTETDQVRLFDDAITLREAIYRTFSAVATEALPAETDLHILNGALALAPPRVRLIREGGHFAWASDIQRLPAQAAPVLLAPVLWSAGDLLAQSENHRIRRCANEKCLWLFVDRSKGGTRRWCDMGACGNRAKSQRHYARIKAS